MKFRKRLDSKKSDRPIWVKSSCLLTDTSKRVTVAGDNHCRKRMKVSLPNHKFMKRCLSTPWKNCPPPPSSACIMTPIFCKSYTLWPHFPLQSTPNDFFFQNFSVIFQFFARFTRISKNGVNFQLKKANFCSLNLTKFTPNDSLFWEVYTLQISLNTSDASCKCSGFVQSVLVQNSRMMISWLR